MESSPQEEPTFSQTYSQFPGAGKARLELLRKHVLVPQEHRAACSPGSCAHGDAHIGGK